MADQLLGSFVWCELLTTDMAGARSFYTKVVGWTSVPFAPDGSYEIFNNAAGAGSGGMMALPEAAKSMGAPPHWMMYIGTPDVDGTVMRVAQLGGRVLKQPADIPEVGRFAVVTDPYGASFALLQPATDGPQRGPIGVGDFSWFELYTPNPDGAWTFYSTLFGWKKTSAMDMGEMGVYQMFGHSDGVPRGGIMQPPPGVPAAWAPYAMVKDAKAAAAATTVNGGQIVNGPVEVPGGDWIAQGIDPQGAMFSVHSLNPAAQKAADRKPRPTKKVAAKKVAAKKVAAKKVAKKAAPKKAAAARTKKQVARKSASRPARRLLKPAKKKGQKKGQEKGGKKGGKKPVWTAGKQKAVRKPKKK